MPNWCHNTLIIEADDHRLIEEFVEAVRDDEDPAQKLSFAKLVPEPGSPDDSGYDWYSWRIENWGTKWDANFGAPFMALGTENSSPAETFQGGFENVGRFTWKFETAWSPPVPWVVAASDKHPNIKFTLRYGEPGNDFAGQVVCRGGRIVSDEELPIDQVLDETEMWF